MARPNTAKYSVAQVKEIAEKSRCSTGMVYNVLFGRNRTGRKELAENVSILTGAPPETYMAQHGVRIDPIPIEKRRAGARRKITSVDQLSNETLLNLLRQARALELEILVALKKRWSQKNRQEVTQDGKVD